MKNNTEAPYLLRKYIDNLRWNFDYILIDCSPSLGVLTQNALVAADSVIIPVDPEFFGVEGVEHIASTMSDVQRKMNPTLEMEGKHKWLKPFAWIYQACRYIRKGLTSKQRKSVMLTEFGNTRQRRELYRTIMGQEKGRE